MSACWAIEDGQGKEVGGGSGPLYVEFVYTSNITTITHDCSEFCPHWMKIACNWPVLGDPPAQGQIAFPKGPDLFLICPSILHIYMQIVYIIKVFRYV